MKLSLALTLLAGTASAFGPATPLHGAVKSSSSSVRRGDLSMNIGKADLDRRQRLNDILVDIRLNNPTAEHVQATLVSDKTGAMIEKCNWKLRKFMVRKVKKTASVFDVEVPAGFGQPMTSEERLAAEQVGKAERAQKKTEAAAAASAAASAAAEAKASKKAAAAAKPKAAAPAPAPAAEPAPAEPAAAPAASSSGGGEITVALIKELRQLTGAGMMDCKKALQESGGDVEQAIENMRKSGALKAAKKATKVAAEGQIIIKEGEGAAAVVEVNCQTDFVAKDASFLDFANQVADAAAAEKLDIDALKAKFEDQRVALVAKIGENIDVRRVQYIEGAQMSTYIHNGGKIGVVVAGSGEDDTLKNLCMHVCASSPQFLSPDDVPAEVVEKERNVQLEIAMGEGKPQEIAEKMVNGRMKKFTGEVALTGQPFVMEPKKSVGDVLKEKGAAVTSFIRLEVGEGIEKSEGPSFAEEVAAMAGN